MSLPHKVTITVPLSVAYGLPRDVWGRERIALSVPEELSWLRENCVGSYGDPRPTSVDKDSNFLFEFQFERQEDAALFKLFWC